MAVARVVEPTPSSSSSGEDPVVALPLEGARPLIREALASAILAVEEEDHVEVESVLPPDATVLLEEEPEQLLEEEKPPRGEVLALVSINNATAQSAHLIQGSPLRVLQRLPEDVPPSHIRTVRISCGRDASNTIVLEDARVSQTHFVVRARICRGVGVVLDMIDESSNGTLLNGTRVVRGQRVPLTVGDQIIVLPAARVGRAAEVGYTLVCDGPALERAPPLATPTTLREDISCSICTDILHRCLTTVPCGHNFCCICMVRWRRKSRTCPECRLIVTQAVRNFAVDRVVDTFVKEHPEEARSKQELEKLEAELPQHGSVMRELLRDGIGVMASPTPARRRAPMPNANSSPRSTRGTAARAGNQAGRNSEGGPTTSAACVIC
eukprot:TRINITY_DN564_c0_g1_i1.p1 TRINITY_DN564_c0_g1~~TRINITY_DN564_c0_g1_i1.p1  ORF type:complete len:418 (-),score=82.25 TRINITY_DN564_c0_g1_i1:291-1436(-)